MSEVLVVTHYTEIPGVSHHLMKYIKQKGIPATFLFLPLNKHKPLPYQILKVNKNKIITLKREYPNTYISDIVFIITNALTNWDIYIGVNSFNTLLGIILKIVLKKRAVIFYSVDYSPNRFSNKLLNIIYKIIDTIASRYSDYIWCTTKRMIYARSKQRGRLEGIIHVPNGTWISYNYRELRKEKEDNNGNVINLVFVGYIGRQFDLDLLISEVNRRRRVKLHIFGDGPQKKYLELIADKEKVKFYGRYPHDQIMKILLRKRWIGIAPYNKKVSHVLYGSPLKVIEYLSCGLPVIVSNIVEIAKDIESRKCGFVYSTYEQLKKVLNKMEELHEDNRLNDLYEEMSKNAVIFAMRFYWPYIYDKSIQKLLQRNNP